MPKKQTAMKSAASDIGKVFDEFADGLEKLMDEQRRRAMHLAVEYGWLAHERGLSLEETYALFNRLTDAIAFKEKNKSTATDAESTKPN